MGNRIVLAACISVCVLSAHGQLDAEPIDRADPSRWILWRCGPLPFPSVIKPMVPETLAAGPAIEFGRFGSNLCIVLPDDLGDDYAGKALRQFATLLVHGKGRNTTVVAAGEFGPAQRDKELIVLGTVAGNGIARAALGDSARDFLQGIPAGGYRIAARPSPYANGRRAILAMGTDGEGAWAAAGILAFSVRPEKARLGAVDRFPVKMPETMCWAPFDATYSGRRDAIVESSPPTPRPTPPRVRFGVRLWGSPMPTLDSYQRLVRALRQSGVNTIVIQSGGWPDLPDAPQRFRKALDIAYAEGILTVLYAGNELEAHHPAPLTENHKAIVRACDVHPGLLGWHLYNQLTARLTPTERTLLQEQTRWLSGQTRKFVAHEIVWGHNSVAIPNDKVTLTEDCKQWGMSVVASDYAPLGGWTKQPDLSRWEGRFLSLRQFGLPTEAVLQAHVPFVDPIIPTASEVRNQFWWALAGGAKAFYFETACLYTHFSFRGLLSWDLRPLDDGRFEEIGKLSQAVERLETVIAESEPVDERESAGLGLSLDPPAAPVAMRFRKASDGRQWLLLVNRLLDRDVVVKVNVTGKPDCSPKAVYPPAGDVPRGASGSFSARLPCGAGACFELVLSKQ